MFDHNDENNGTANQHSESYDAHQTGTDYLALAREAYAAGNHVMAMHLYLTAYEEACKKSPLPDMGAIGALREAWHVACELKERSIAEYVFDKLEPHLSSREAEEFAHTLQSLALDKLSEFGISRSDLEDMADMISEELGAAAHISGIAPVMTTRVVPSLAASDEPDAQGGEEALVLHDGAEADTAQLDAPGDEGEASEATTAEPAPGNPAPAKPVATLRAIAVPKQEKTKRRYSFGYADLVGFDGIIEDARALGLGVQHDEEYRALIDTLRAQHGLEGLSATGSVVFRTSSREDASMFMNAVVGELDLPAMRVQMQPGPQGMPVLAVTVSSDRQPRSAQRMALEVPSVLVLEDIDLWGAPLIEAASAMEGENIMLASMARASREAVTLIGSAVANPDIYVLASMAGDAVDQGYLYDLMEPMSVIDIYMPDEVERRQIWNRIALDHPSVRQLDLARLTRLSRNLSRFDIANAAREAVEDAYKQSLRARRYVPVTQSMMFEHVANFQPLESDEYRTLEEAVVSDFRSQLSELDDMLEAEMRIEENPEVAPVPPAVETGALVEDEVSANVADEAASSEGEEAVAEGSAEAAVDGSPDEAAAAEARDDGEAVASAVEMEQPRGEEDGLANAAAAPEEGEPNEGEVR